LSIKPAIHSLIEYYICVEYCFGDRKLVTKLAVSLIMLHYCGGKYTKSRIVIMVKGLRPGKKVLILSIKDSISSY